MNNSNIEAFPTSNTVLAVLKKIKDATQHFKNYCNVTTKEMPLVSLNMKSLSETQSLIRVKWNISKTVGVIVVDTDASNISFTASRKTLNVVVNLDMLYMPLIKIEKYSLKEFLDLPAFTDEITKNINKDYVMAAPHDTHSLAQAVKVVDRKTSITPAGELEFRKRDSGSIIYPDSVLWVDQVIKIKPLSLSEYDGYVDNSVVLTGHGFVSKEDFITDDAAKVVNEPYLFVTESGATYIFDIPEGYSHKRLEHSSIVSNVYGDVTILNNAVLKSITYKK